MERRQVAITELNQLKEHWPGDVAPIQLSSGPLGMFLDGAVEKDFGILHMGIHPRIVDRAYTYPGKVGFVLAERPTIWCGVKVVPPALIVVRPKLETRSVLEPGFRSVEFFMSDQLLAKHELGNVIRRRRWDPAEAVLPLSGRAASRLRQAASDYIDSCQCSEMIQAYRRDLVITELENIVLTGIDHASIRRCASSRRCGALAFDALEEIDRVGIRDTSLPELLNTLGVSRRALEKSFETVLGISPGRYLTACRLNGLRSLLLQNATRVTESVYDAGFNDLSRAAGQYRRMYGELPSQTLRRATG